MSPRIADGDRGEGLRATRSPPLSLILTALAADETRATISVGDILAVMGDRAFGPLMFVFAAPNLVPTPPGTSAVLGLPLIVLAAKAMLGKPAWLPAFVTRRAMKREDFAAMAARLAPWLERAEALLKPRLSHLARPPVERIAAFVSLLLAILVTLPIPFANIVPALAIAIFALGILGRDGLWMIAGFATAAAAFALVGGVYYAAFAAAMLMLV